MINLGTLKGITDLRSVWPHEALNFTPWVAENVELLADAVGLDIKELFKSLLSHKDEIESVMGVALDWRELPERKASRIIIEKEVTFDDHATWSQQFDYIMDVCMKMKKAFKKYI